MSKKVITTNTSAEYRQQLRISTSSKNGKLAWMYLSDESGNHIAIEISKRVEIEVKEESNETEAR